MWENYPMFATEILQKYLDAHTNNEVLSNSQAGSINLLSDDNPELPTYCGSTSNATVWTHGETLELIHAYETFKDQFNNARKRKYVWSNIVICLESHGIIKSEKVVETKWKNLLRTYKAIKDNNNRTGKGAVRFQFMEEMENVVGKRPLISSQNAVGVGIAGLTDSINKVNVKVVPVSPCEESDQNNSSGATEKEKIQKTDNNASKKTKESGTALLKRNYSKLKMEEIKDKKEKRQQFLNFIIDEKCKKREREENLIKLREKELEIEEKKVKVLEELISSNTKFVI